MSILRGHFAMTLIVAAPDDADEEGLRVDLEAVRDRLGLEAISLGRVEALDADAAPGPSHTVTVYGADHPGIVHAVSSALAERDASITDLTTRLVGEGGGDPLYAMMMEVALPEPEAEDDLQRALDAVRDEQKVEVSLRPLEQDAL